MRLARIGLVSLLLALPTQRAGYIPGVPEACCGYWDCRKAKTAVLAFLGQKARVSVDGKEIVIPLNRLHYSRRGWYCSVCVEGQISGHCTLCVIVRGPGFAETIRVIPVEAKLKLLLPAGQACASCHSR